MPKAKMPSAGRVWSSGVRLSRRSVPSPTPSSPMVANQGSQAGPPPPSQAAGRLISSAASGTSTSRSASGARGAFARTMPRYSKAAQVRKKATKAKNPGPESRKMPASKTGMPTRAVTTRFIAGDGSLAARVRATLAAAAGGEEIGRFGLVQPAEAAPALLVVEQGGIQVAAAEVGPERVGDPDLGVGDLP